MWTHKGSTAFLVVVQVQDCTCSSSGTDVANYFIQFGVLHRLLRVRIKSLCRVAPIALAFLFGQDCPAFTYDNEKELRYKVYPSMLQQRFNDK